MKKGRVISIGAINVGKSICSVVNGCIIIINLLL